MDRARFSKTAPGELIKIDARDWAFVPAPLPPDWSVPLELWPLLGESKQRIGMLEGIGHNLPNPEILLTPLQQREALRSSSLEGTFATPRELLLFEMEPREAKSATDPSNAWREVSNYREALRTGMTRKIPFSLRLIRDLHRQLLDGVRGRDQRPGEFRKGQVYIGHDKRFVPPPATALAGCLDAFEKYLHAEDTLDPLVRCYLIHYQFEAIHPFHDGNGRIGRVLLALMTQEWCNLSKPWLYLSPYFEEHKDEYFDRLFAVSAKGAWTEWIEFCLRGTIRQATDAFVRCNKLLKLRDEFDARITKVRGSVRLSRIADRLFTSPYLTVGDAMKQLEVSYPTAQGDIARLVKSKILKELPDLYPKTFYAPEVHAVVFDDIDEE